MESVWADSVDFRRFFCPGLVLLVDSPSLPRCPEDDGKLELLVDIVVVDLARFVDLEDKEDPTPVVAAVAVAVPVVEDSRVFLRSVDNVAGLVAAGFLLFLGFEDIEDVVEAADFFVELCSVVVDLIVEFEL